MKQRITTASDEELDKTRSLLRVHVLACKIYQLAEEPTYYDGQPVDAAMEKANGMIERIDVELARREQQVYRYYLLNRPPSIGTHPPNPMALDVWAPSRRIPEQPADHDRHAHGWVEYAEPLSEDDIDRYELWHVGMLEA